MGYLEEKEALLVAERSLQLFLLVCVTGFIDNSVTEQMIKKQMMRFLKSLVIFYLRGVCFLATGFLRDAHFIHRRCPR